MVRPKGTALMILYYMGFLVHEDTALRIHSFDHRITVLMGVFARNNHIFPFHFVHIILVDFVHSFLFVSLLYKSPI